MDTKAQRKTLVILAAGVGSRFGGGIKQLEPIDDYGRIILEYSVYDAIMAGFQKIIFVIRHDILHAFGERVGDRMEALCGKFGVEMVYVFQDQNDLPRYILAAGRAKPWGTGQAVWACRRDIDGPFAVINADDYYGATAFVPVANFLDNKTQYGLMAYVLKNTLSEHGGVTRGICHVEKSRLVRIDETKNIVRDGLLARAGDKYYGLEALVSMNFWCFPKDFIDFLEEDFAQFLLGIEDPLADEYLLPQIADRMLQAGTRFTVLTTEEKWCGVTYKEDVPQARKFFTDMLAQGLYPTEW